jgi:hypothetical protein
MRGWMFSNPGVHICLSKQDQEIMFDTIDKTAKGFLVTVQMQPLFPIQLDNNKWKTYERYHKMHQPTHQIFNYMPTHLLDDVTPNQTNTSINKSPYCRDK